MVGDQRFRYNQVNLGFTIQSENTLYLVVVREAEKMSPAEFVRSLNRLHKRVMARKLTVEDLSGATVGFSSMSRWNASRHIPILPPHVSLMVAHTTSRSGEGVLGATYDHRLLSGGDTVQVLTELVVPPANLTEQLLNEQ
jgi:pyruvate/2-oxoglutarate dehydrogenase complex dihydrolipoamide acyltransferase (E2) component